MISLRVKGSFGGWARDRVIELNDGSVWRQAEDHYEYRFSHKPPVEIENGQMSAKGMKRAVKVERIK